LTPLYGSIHPIKPGLFAAVDFMKDSAKFGAEDVI
jgi:hypothetical protein